MTSETDCKTFTPRKIMFMELVSFKKGKRMGTAPQNCQNQHTVWHNTQKAEHMEYWGTICSNTGHKWKMMTAICTTLCYCPSAQIKPENLHVKTPCVFTMSTCKTMTCQVHIKAICIFSCYTGKFWYQDISWKAQNGNDSFLCCLKQCPKDRFLTNRDITIPVCNAEYNFAQSFTIGKQHENIGVVM